MTTHLLPEKKTARQLCNSL